MAFYDEPPVFSIVMNITLSIFFLFDLILNFNRAYPNSRGKMVTNRSKIAFSYIKFWFWIDLFSFIPLNLFFPRIKNFNQGFKLLKISKIFNLIYFTRVFKVIKESCQGRNKTSLMQYNLQFKTGRELFYIQIFSNMLAMHFMACFAYGIPTGFSPELNWVILREITDRNIFDKYLFSLHWTVETFITVGYGENSVT